MCTWRSFIQPHIASVKEKMCFMPQKVEHTLWLAEFKLYTHVHCKFMSTPKATSTNLQICDVLG